jgi:CheY-like chemotaxis protein
MAAQANSNPGVIRRSKRPPGLKRFLVEAHHPAWRFDSQAAHEPASFAARFWQEAKVFSMCPSSKRTVLCIDDDEAILDYEKALLERSGYTVLTAASAQQGLNLVAMCKCDAVLLDYQMPGMSGHEVALEIKLVRPELMVILLSGSDVPSHALRFVDAFVPKLEANRQLLPMLDELCSRTG